MARSITARARSVFGSKALKWTEQSATFSLKARANVQFTEYRTVATRKKADGWFWNDCVVSITEPVPIGSMFQVTVRNHPRARTGDEPLGSVNIGLTKAKPETSTLAPRVILKWESGDEDLLSLNTASPVESVKYNDKKLCKVDFNTYDQCQSLGMLLTRQGHLHWFLDGKWRGVVNVDGFTLDQPMWGVLAMSGHYEQVSAEICTVSHYDVSHERQLLEMGLIKRAASPKPAKLRQTTSEDVLQQLLQEQESLRQQVQRKDGQLQQLQQDLTRDRAKLDQERLRIRRLQERLSQERETVRQLEQQQVHARESVRRLEEQLAQANRLSEASRAVQQQLAQRNATISLLEEQLAQSNQLRQQADTENQQQITTLRQQIDVLQRRVSSLSAANRSVNSHEVEFWQVSPEEVSIREHQILGTGAWGYVTKGTFRGTPVAVKCVHREILQQATLERIRREIRTMAQIRHPNLVLFIAAVLDEQTGPMIVIELLDTSLRAAYQTNRIGANKRKIFGDVSSALVYLHRQREPIIHRDLNSANVLLASLSNDMWLAKLSDFGSANLARYASTLGEGAILYTAPEAYPQPPTSTRPPPPQTTKIDVYSFGVVACEVVTGVFPEAHRFADLLSSVSRVWPQIHPLITSCVSHSPQDRPTMDTVLSQIKQLDWEPN